MKLRILTRLLAIGCGSAFTAALVYSSPAMAVDYGVELRYDYTYTDNVNLVQVNPQGEHINIYTVNFLLDHKSPKLEANVISTIQYLDYVNDKADDNTLTTVNARALFKISPQHFTWLLQNIINQNKVNGSAAATPSNTQRTTVWITGPDYTIRINPVNNIVLRARYFDIRYETTDLDNKRDLVGVSWVKQVNTRNIWSLNLIGQRVDYDNEVLNTNFDRGDWFLRWETRPGKNIIIFDAGKSVIRRRGMDDLDGDLQRFSWARTINSNSRFDLLLSRMLSDAGQQLGASVFETTDAVGTSAIGTGTSGSLTTNGIFFSERADLSYTLRKGSYAYQLSLLYAEDDYELQPIDEIRKGGTFSIRHNFTPTVTGTLSFTETNGEFLNVDRENRDTIRSLTVAWRLARRFTLNFSAIRNERKSIGIDRDIDYVEHRYAVGVAYTFGKGVEKQRGIWSPGASRAL